VVTADTHVGGRRRRPLPRALLSACAGADVILHCGDLIVGEVLDELGAYAPVHAVLGNVDGWELVDRLPERRVVELGALRVGMLHDPGQAQGRAARLARAFPGCRLVCFGHTHLPQLDQHGTTRILNPGSPTERRRAPHRSYALLDVREDGSFDVEIVPLEESQ
jgi:putative phosphoesterase